MGNGADGDRPAYCCGIHRFLSVSESRINTDANSFRAVAIFPCGLFPLNARLWHGNVWMVQEVTTEIHIVPLAARTARGPKLALLLDDLPDDYDPLEPVERRGDE